ncbi:MAG: FAD-dependent thymidylate synthase [Eubacteriales bacterium]|nr:FAD-dependent thymidylate synthase [Eubacteriales bacterium]
MNITKVGEGKVVLIAGGGKIYTDLAARFTRSEKGLVELLSSEDDAKLVRTIVDKGHLAATEFDYFLFGVEGYSRVTEAQLVRKRLASYLIKSGRIEKHGRRSFDVAVPDGILDHKCSCKLKNGDSIELDGHDLLDLTEQWYNSGVNAGLREEDLRYLKPEATEFKALIGMNAHALLDWFKIRCCQNAQAEIRDMAWKMLRLCKQAAPELFETAGPSCVSLGYCPENDFQNKHCHVIRKDAAMKILQDYSKK